MIPINCATLQIQIIYRKLFVLDMDFYGDPIPCFFTRINEIFVFINQHPALHRKTERPFSPKYKWN